MSPIARIALGLALMVAAWPLHDKSHQLYFKSLGLPPQKTANSTGDNDFFDRPRPSDYAKTEPARAMRSEAFWWKRLASVADFCGGLLMLMGVFPLVVPSPVRERIALYLNDLIRERLSDDNPDCGGRPDGGAGDGEPAGQAQEAAPVE